VCGDRDLRRTLPLSRLLAHPLPLRSARGTWIGEAFQPLEGGTSVAFVGILGGLAAYSLLEREPELVRWRPQATIAIPLAILDTALGDIHGVPFMVGLVIGTAWVLREEPAGSRGRRLRVALRFRSIRAGESFPPFAGRN
jgi:hypothetical protein